MPELVVHRVQVGRVRPFGPRQSAIVKELVACAVRVTARGLDGDEHADLVHHGGPDKAVHAYPLAHYATWAADLPSDGMEVGAFGENLTVAGVTEADICLGDRWRVGEVLLEVSQARQPCWKLNVRFGVPDMARRVQASGRTGWYFRVLEEGSVAQGARGSLTSRPQPDWPLTRVARVLYRDLHDRAALAELAAMPGIPEGWRELARRRLASGQVEDWTPRVETPRPG